jgi:hypothetical protein
VMSNRSSPFMTAMILPHGITPEVVPEPVQVLCLQLQIQLLVQRHTKHDDRVIKAKISQDGQLGNETSKEAHYGKVRVQALRDVRVPNLDSDELNRNRDVIIGIHKALAPISSNFKCKSEVPLFSCFPRQFFIMRGGMPALLLRLVSCKTSVTCDTFAGGSSMHRN